MPEGSEYYETVRYVTMNGYMRAVSETEFGVDKPAAAGELLEGLSMLIAGGPMGAEDLRDALAGMGYLPADLDVDIRALGVLGVGAIGLEEAALREDVEILGNRETLERVFVRKPIMVSVKY